MGITHKLDGETIHSEEHMLYFMMFLLGLNFFRPYFKMFLANGISRRTFFCSLAVVLSATAAAISLAQSLSTLLLSSYNYRSIFLQNYYGSMQSMHYTLQIFVQQFLWQTFGYIWFAMIGLFITSLYYRMSKALKITVSIGVPILFLCVFPILDFALLSGRISHALQILYNFACGYSNGCNPYIGIASMFVFTVVTAALAWLPIRRANVKS